MWRASYNDSKRAGRSPIKAAPCPLYTDKLCRTIYQKGYRTMRPVFAVNRESLIDSAHTDLIWWQRGEKEQAAREGREPVICPVGLRWVAEQEVDGAIVDLATGLIVGAL